MRGIGESFGDDGAGVVVVRDVRETEMEDERSERQFRGHENDDVCEVAFDEQGPQATCLRESRGPSSTSAPDLVGRAGADGYVPTFGWVTSLCRNRGSWVLGCCSGVLRADGWFSGF